MNKFNDLVLSYLFITSRTFVFIAVNKKKKCFSSQTNTNSSASLQTPLSPLPHPAEKIPCPWPSRI